MYWLAVRDGSPRLVAMRILFVLTPVWFFILLASLFVPNRTNREAAFVTAFFSAYGLHLVIKILIATEAGRRMSEDRRSGAWELLLVTPLRVEEILQGQLQALRRHFRGAMITLGAINIMMALTVLFSPDCWICVPPTSFYFVKFFWAASSRWRQTFTDYAGWACGAA